VSENDGEMKKRYFYRNGERRRCLSHCATQGIRPKVKLVADEVNRFLVHPVIVQGVNSSCDAKDQHYTKREHARWRDEDVEVSEEGLSLSSTEGTARVFVRPHQRLVEIEWLCLVPNSRALRTQVDKMSTTIGLVYEHLAMKQVFPLVSVPEHWRYPVAMCLIAGNCGAATGCLNSGFFFFKLQAIKV